MKTRRIISLHPKLAAVLDAGLGILLFWWLGKIGTVSSLAWWMGIRLVWWLGLVESMYFPPFVSRLKQWGSLALFLLGWSVFLILLDSKLGWYIGGFLYIIVPFVSFWLIPAADQGLAIISKPHRRWRFLMILITLAGLWCAAAAGLTLQIVDWSRLWIVLMVGGVVTALVSVWWWMEYDIPFTRRAALLGGVQGLLIAELSYAILLWPVGYFLIAILIPWLWYLVWLMFRFHLSSTGINWQRQRLFFIVHGILLAIFILGVLRWR